VRELDAPPITLIGVLIVAAGSLRNGSGDREGAADRRRRGWTPYNCGELLFQCVHLGRDVGLAKIATASTM